MMILGAAPSSTRTAAFTSTGTSSFSFFAQASVGFGKNHGFHASGHIFEHALRVEFAFARLHDLQSADDAAECSTHLCWCRSSSPKFRRRLSREAEELVLIFFQWMSADEEAQHFLFRSKALVCFPLRHVRQCFGFTRMAAAPGSSRRRTIRLATVAVALRFLCTLHGFIEHVHELRASAERIHGAALDE